jgi:hypothetical protein
LNYSQRGTHTPFASDRNPKEDQYVKIAESNVNKAEKANKMSKLALEIYQ